MKLFLKWCAIAAVAAGAVSSRSADAPRKVSDADTVKAEHDALDNATAAVRSTHNPHPDAQWYPEAGLGLFIHWGLCSVKAINISWSMIEGLNGQHAQISPNDYWAQAQEFDPRKYDPDKWLKAAREAGFVYAVLTARHHEGFALWPSAYGDFNTKNYIGGRDLVKEYVDACRRNGLKVGLYYSPPDWHFERATKNFSRNKGEVFGPDLKPRPAPPTAGELAAQAREYSKMIRGQLEELLTRYGKIDLLWFDGKAPGVDANECMSLERIRELQPGIVVNVRWHGRGDFGTFERALKTDQVKDGWWEYCNTWTPYWSHVDPAPFRAPGHILSQLALCRSLQMNYLPGVGPTKDGEFVDEIYRNFDVVRDWMNVNGASVKKVKALPAGESASVPATSAGEVRYLFALPRFQNDGADDHVYPSDLLPAADATLTLKGIAKPVSVKLLGSPDDVDFSYVDRTLTVRLRANQRTKLVDVVKVELR
jgi:alpha-L-fucosidase